MTQGRARKFDSIQVLRAVAVLIVVGRHLLVFISGTGQGPTGKHGDFGLVGDGGVDLFFVISGFVMVVTTRHRERGRPTAADFAYARVTRIYPLYWCYTLLLAAVVVVAPNLVNRIRSGGHIDILRSFFLVPQKGSPLVGQGWSLVHEMYFYAVFTLLLLVVAARWRLPLIALWGVLILAATHDGDVPTEPFAAIVLNPLTLEFVAGAIVGAALLRWQARIRSPWIGIVVATGGAGMLLYEAVMQATSWHEMPVNYDRIIAYGVPGVLLVAGFAAVELARDNIVFPRALVRVGDTSYSIYLSHIIVVGAITKVTPDVAVLPYDLALGLVIVAAVIVAGEVSFRVVEQPLLQLSRRYRRRRPVAVPPSG